MLPRVAENGLQFVPTIFLTMVKCLHGSMGLTREQIRHDLTFLEAKLAAHDVANNEMRRQSNELHTSAYKKKKEKRRKRGKLHLGIKRDQLLYLEIKT